MTRLEVELEFIQSLANPFYCHYLAQEGYLDKQECVNYLNYLQYWRRPEYAKLIKFPDALEHLQALSQSAEQRNKFKLYEYALECYNKQHTRWLTWRN
jgi:mediator of RNA polymerase II transcription subunit 31